MNVYEKLNEARLKFQSMGIKQNGRNDFARYNYFELFDILPAVNQINKELKTACVVKFEENIAILEFIDCEKPEDKIIFTSPMSNAQLKGCHEVQNLGAVESYIKRYLYQNCFEIAECDAVDRTMNPNVAYDNKKGIKQKGTEQKNNVPTDADLEHEQIANDLQNMLNKYAKFITQEIGQKCEDALNGNGDVKEMYNRLQAYLSKKGVA